MIHPVCSREGTEKLCRKPGEKASRGERDWPFPAAPNRTRTVCPLSLRDVLRLETLRPLLDLELHGLAFGQGFIAIHLDCRKVNENIFARLALDGTIPLGRIEPLHDTLFSTQLRRSLICEVALGRG